MDELLKNALSGVKLTEREERYLEWLSRMDSETVGLKKLLPLFHGLNE